jgi:hypothetical protein
MSRRNVQRKRGTTSRSPRRARTARASRISRRAAKSRCACEWGGWGRISVDGPRQNNSDRSEDPWGRAAKSARTAVLKARHVPRHSTGCTTRQAGSTKDGGKPADAEGSRPMGRPRLTCRPLSRTGENPPYGILGEVVETSASYEARYAPPPYPTAGFRRPRGDGPAPVLRSAERTSARGPAPGPVMRPRVCVL